MSLNNDLEPVEVLELFQKRPAVIKPGLDRIKSALQLLGQPGSKTPRIVIAGTNGKGSTSGFIWRLLAASGIRAGLFSSPHLLEFRERITVTDTDVSNGLIVNHVQKLKKNLPPQLWNDLTFIEVNTIIAFMIFDELKNEVNVLEVGLGGRWDCCNIYDPDVSVITSIGLDHQEFLGSSLTGIAKEKAGVMRRDRPVIWGGLLSSDLEAHDTILAEAQNIGAVLFSEEKEPDFPLPASICRRPDFLRRNFRLAVIALREFSKTGILPGLTTNSVTDSIKQFDRAELPWPVTLKGRFDCVRVSKGAESRVALVDVCHNPHGAKALAKALEEMGVVPEGRKHPCLISVLSDKDASGIWAEIKGKISEAIRFRIPSTRTWTVQDTRIDGVMMESIDEAWREALSRESWAKNQPWLIFGSVAAVGEVFAYWQRAGWSVERITQK